MTCSRTTLLARTLFASLPDAQLDAIAPWVQMRSFPARAHLLRTGELPHGLFIVTSGRVKVLLDDGHGREVIVETLGPDQFFGEASLFRERASLQAYVAQQATDVLYVPRKPLLECLERNPAAALFVARTLAERLEIAHLKIGSLGLHDVYVRVVDLLLASGREDSGVWLVDVGSELIAALVGASREMVSRVLKDLAERGLVRRQRRKIVVPDRDALRACALRRREAADARKSGYAAGAKRRAPEAAARPSAHSQT